MTEEEYSSLMNESVLLQTEVEDEVGKKTRFAKMANVFERSSSREFTGSGCTVSGLNSSLAFRSDPLGFN